MKQKLNCILLVDDDEATNFINKMIIKRVDCSEHVQVEDDGQKALDFLTTKLNDEYPRPNLIFLDINMPVVDGWEFLDRYKHLNADQKGEVIIIMLTTSLNPDDQTRAELLTEISGFKRKQLTVEMLNEILIEHFADRL